MNPWKKGKGTGKKGFEYRQGSYLRGGKEGEGY